MVENQEVKIEKQDNFPYLKEYKKQFPITDGTIFVFKDKIYSNNEMPYDIVFHEIRHLQQQQQYGADKWIKQYLEDKNFRLSVELDAYKHQLKKVKEIADEKEYLHILVECAQNISSPLYGDVISYAGAIKKLKVK